MKEILLIIAICLWAWRADAQFPPPAGQPGTTAIHMDSSVFASWATGCTIVRGHQDISNTSLGYATHGDSTAALGKADGNGVVSLGDGGYAILTFAKPIQDSTGWDFAIFENSFSDSFLELAFVEVSSDGVHFFRFPATSFTQDTLQLGGFGNMDATRIDNLAGKYRVQYGTPFDLQQLSGHAGLHTDAVTHVKIIDVVGCIQEPYCTFDQYGNKVNDPWSTPFASGGFDLDAVGVIHYNQTQAVPRTLTEKEISLYPNPVKSGGALHISIPYQVMNIMELSVYDLTGRLVLSRKITKQHIDLPMPDNLRGGVYWLRITGNNFSVSKKLIIE